VDFINGPMSVKVMGRMGHSLPRKKKKKEFRRPRGLGVQLVIVEITIYITGFVHILKTLT
jgi:hypothetical protein